MKRQLYHKPLFLSVVVFCSFMISHPSFSQEIRLKAVTDTIDVYPYVPTVFNILANDTIPPGDTVARVLVSSSTYVKSTNQANKIFTFQGRYWGYRGLDSSNYRIYSYSGDTSSAKLIFRIHDNSYDYLNINNVNARFNASGLQFYPLLGRDPMFEVPKGSRKNSIFSNSLWIGGRDEQDSLHFAGERYRQGPGTGMPWSSPDFYAGPIMDSINYSIFQDTAWNYIWNLKKSEIDYHRAHFWETGYEPIKDIRSWPGNGDTALGQAHKLAPFFDRNGDGIYDPMDGDYPEIRGDQALFFIFNDDRGPHLESEGEKLRVEIHGMAYAFDLPDDSAFKNTVFLHYKIYNRSQHAYDSTYVGIFTDIDLGYSNDDYIGCDVERNIYYAYNGTPIDGTGQESAYGENPPAQAVSIMAGPYLDPDGTDNPRYGPDGNQLCDHSINGIHFGDSVVDNERYGLCKFVYFNNSNAGVPAYMTDPLYAFEYYKFLRGIWKDDTRMIYGGNGHAYAGGYGPACDFMFPGESDSLDWGTGCQQPNGPKNWTEEIAGNNPQDRRGMGSMGPFTFQPGGVQEIDFAFTWARDYTSRTPLSSLAKLRTFIDTINAAFASNTLPGGNPFYGISDRTKPLELWLEVYPNPTKDLINIQFDTQAITGNSNIVLQTVQGNLLKRFVFPSPLSTFTIDVSDIPPGLYLLKVVNHERIGTKKVIVMR